MLATFLDLINVSLDDDYRRDVRTSRRKDALDPEQQKLVDDLVRARLLSVSTVGDVETVNIVHESLINNWDRLREGVHEKRAALQRRVRFEQDVRDWVDSGKSADYLLRGMALARAQELEDIDDVALRGEDAQNARELLTRSEAAEAAQRNRELAQASRVIISRVGVTSGWH